MRVLNWTLAMSLACAASACIVHTNSPAPASNPSPPPPAAPAPAAAAPAPETTAAAPAPAPDNQEIPADPNDPAPVTAPLPPQQKVEPLPPVRGNPERLIDGAADGRPSGLQPGAPAAYWIWQNPNGVWKLRTTTANKLHEFRGGVVGVDGAISGFRPSRAEFKDRIIREPGGGLLFRFHTQGHVDGLDFKAPGCVKFQLQLDRGASQKRVFVGRGAVSPRTNHFVLCPKK